MSAVRTCGIAGGSGSGKSAENYRVMGEVTGGRLEIKTSGRYTYEMGRALFASSELVIRRQTDRPPITKWGTEDASWTEVKELFRGESGTKGVAP
mgnify:CR=1 FL=1